MYKYLSEATLPQEVLSCHDYYAAGAAGAAASAAGAAAASAGATK